MGNTSEDDLGRLVIEFDAELANSLFEGFNKMMEQQPTNGEVMGAVGQMIAKWITQVQEYNDEDTADYVLVQLFATVQVMRGKQIDGMQHFEVPKE